jgi:hypothetical protein
LCLAPQADRAHLAVSHGVGEAVGFTVDGAPRAVAHLAIVEALIFGKPDHRHIECARQRNLVLLDVFSVLIGIEPVFHLIIVPQKYKGASIIWGTKKNRQGDCPRGARSLQSSALFSVVPPRRRAGLPALLELLGTREGQILINSFVRITDAEIRRSFVCLVEKAATLIDSKPPKPKQSSPRPKKNK